MYNPHPYPLSTYPASRGFSFAWLLAFKKSFAWLVCRVVVALWDVNKPTTRLTRHANDFVNAKNHASEKPLLAGYSAHHRGLTSDAG